MLIYIYIYVYIYISGCNIIIHSPEISESADGSP